MGEHFPELLGILVSVIGIVFLFLKWFQHQLGASIKQMADAINARIDTEVCRLNDEDAKLDSGISAVRVQVSERVRNIEVGVVYKDVFEQHSKAMDARHETVLMMNQNLTEQLKATSTQNSAEHARICGKMDAIPTIIQETIRLMNNNK